VVIADVSGQHIGSVSKNQENIWTDMLSRNVVRNYHYTLRRSSEKALFSSSSRRKLEILQALICSR